MKKGTVAVRLEWIIDSVAIHPKGGCQFHLREDGSGKPFPTCGCCLLAKAYLDAPERPRRQGVLWAVLCRSDEVHPTGQLAYSRRAGALGWRRVLHGLTTCGPHRVAKLEEVRRS